MWPTNLEGAERAAYRDACNTESTTTKVEVDILTLDHDFVASLDDEFNDGQVNFNGGGLDVAQTLQAGFYDPSSDLADLDIRYLIQVKHRLYVPSLAKWATTPVFTGRIVVPSTEGDTTTLEAHSKETFALQPGAPRRHWESGRRIARVIREMFEDIGETKFRISQGLAAKLKQDMASGGPDDAKVPWRVARRMAKQAGLQLFYDELGFLVLRRAPKNPVVTWTESDEDSGLKSPVKWTRDLRQIRNVVQASGKKTLKYKAVAPDNHVFHPKRLRRGGVADSGEMVHFWDDDSIAKPKDLKEGAERLLDRFLTQTSVAQLECMPLYHLSPYDRVRAQKRDGSYGDFFPLEGTKPLGGDGSMTIGYQQKQRRATAGRIRIK